MPKALLETWKLKLTQSCTPYQLENVHGKHPNASSQACWVTDFNILHDPSSAETCFVCMSGHNPQRGSKSLESIWTNLTDLIMKILSPASKQICSFLLLLDHNSRENERKGDQKIAICFYSTNKTMGGNSSFKTIYIRDPGSSGFKILSKIRRHRRAEVEGANGSTGNPGVKHGLLTNRLNKSSCQAQCCVAKRGSTEAR